MGQGIASVRQGDDESIEEDTAGVEDEDEELEAGADFAVKIAKEGDAGRFDAELSYDVFELSIALNAAPLTYQV
ncbi:MAG TPA: hypothetical protein VFS41_12540 [Edaphobacter sp.]|nr:hypothetical protein [Edaphobacter sp.]